MINDIKQKLAGIDYVIELANSQGCSVKLKKRNQWDIFESRIEYYFAKFSKSSGDRYNINPSNEKPVSELEHFHFDQCGFAIIDLLVLTLDHITALGDNNLTEFVVILDERELMDDAEDKVHNTDGIHWAWDYIESTFTGLHEQGKELEPQKIYKIEDGKLHVHFKLLDVKI